MTHWLRYEDANLMARIGKPQIEGRKVAIVSYPEETHRAYTFGSANHDISFSADPR
jgi:hypothetical protein